MGQIGNPARDKLLVRKLAQFSYEQREQFVALWVLLWSASEGSYARRLTPLFNLGYEYILVDIGVKTYLHMTLGMWTFCESSILAPEVFPDKEGNPRRRLSRFYGKESVPCPSVRLFVDGEEVVST